MPDAAANQGRQEVVLLLDPDDDIAVQTALRDRCTRGSGRLLISPGPRHWWSDTLAGNVLTALGVWDRRGSRPCNEQLRLDADMPWTPEAPVQLMLFESPPASWERHLPFRRPRSLGDAIRPIREAGITDLYVLRAQALRTSAWTLLVAFARETGVRLHLVVHGRAPSPEPLRALAGCRVTTQSVDGRRSVQPWWTKPVFRGDSGRTPSALRDRGDQETAA